MEKQKKVTIVGAGLTGLVAGYELSKKGYRVTIYEKESDIGGLMGGFKIADTSVEKTYHHIFKTDKYIVDLIKELDLEEKLHWYPEKTALYYENKMYPFLGATDLLKFKPLDLIAKFRLGLVKIWLEKDNNWEKYKTVTAVEWMKKYCGDEGYKVIWEPLLKGKFHNYYDKISMAWMWARIHTRANSDGSLGYLDGGFQQVAEELVKRILQNKGEIKLNSKLKTLKPKKEEKIIFTGPSKEINYLGAINVVFTSTQSLSPYYWHNINDAKSPFLAFIQHTNLVDKKQYDNKNVYYMGTYLPQDHKYFNDNDKLIKKDFFEYLKHIFPKFDQKIVDQVWVYKFEKAQHIVDIKYKIPKSKIEKNIYVTNFSQIFPEDRGMNFAVREGEKIAKKIIK
jgi:protoporphyrinogen oxidase